jgi:hypothetical protein
MPSASTCVGGADAPDVVRRLDGAVAADARAGARLLGEDAAGALAGVRAGGTAAVDALAGARLGGTEAATALAGPAAAIATCATARSTINGLPRWSPRGRLPRCGAPGREGRG